LQIATGYEQRQVRERGSGDRDRAVGRAVVHDDDLRRSGADVLTQRAHAFDEQVAALVVHDDRGPTGRCFAQQGGALGAGAPNTVVLGAAAELPVNPPGAVVAVVAEPALDDDPLVPAGVDTPVKSVPRTTATSASVSWESSTRRGDGST
jgi:hypothetical protein